MRVAVTRPADDFAQQPFPTTHDMRRQNAAQEDAMKALVNFFRNEDGQDLLEYALLVALIAIVAVGAVTAAGTTVNGIFTQIAGQI
jgi:pilus assembly protein Flp/PilA